jgi:hypothetical protein
MTKGTFRQVGLDMNNQNQIQLSLAWALGLKNTASDKTTALRKITSSENVQNGLKQGNYFFTLLHLRSRICHWDGSSKPGATEVYINREVNKI